MKKIRLITTFLILFVFFSCTSNQPQKEVSKKEQIVEPLITENALSKEDTTIVDTQETETSPLKEKPKERVKQASKTTTKPFLGFANFYAQFDKAPQNFTINSATDNTINGKEGTQITFKASSLETLDGRAVEGPVNIQLTEYYQFADMMRANLNTMSNGKILETGGMVNVEAFYKGKKCRLKSGKTIDIDFPNAPDDMQIFEGDWTNGEVNWTTSPTRSFGTIKRLFPIDENIRKYFIDEEITNIIQKSIEYPEKARKKRLQGRAKVKFFSLQDGSIVAPYIPFNIDTLFENAAIAAVKKLPKGLFGYEKKQHSISFKFNMKDGFDNMGKVTFSIKMDDGKFDPSAIPPSAAEIARKAEKMQAERTTKRNVSQINQTLLSASRLGWINIDRLLKLEGPKTDLIVDVKNAKYLNLKLVLKDINSIVMGIRKKENRVFKNLPENSEVVLVAVKFENDQYYLAVTHTNTNDKNPKLNYELASKEKIEEKMLQLNRS